MPANIAIQPKKEQINLLRVQSSSSQNNSTDHAVEDDQVTYQKPCCGKHSPPQNKNKQKSKNVSFVEIVQVHLVLHVNDMDDEEYFGTWYEESELKNIRSAMRNTILKMIRSRHSEADKMESNETTRGLEYRTKSGEKRRRLNKYMALCSVMREQARQLQEDIHDEEAIRSTYLKDSRHCAAAAHKLGKLDEKEARRIHKENLGRFHKKHKSTFS
mmetsp:Transcript_30762/g.70882  ORF Transcript_30762/g.70882 Transcript_30762/m.70882 type:complete len:215 (+) Transcript_30762:58-702(+)